jgi:hypothetical protein
MHEGGTCGFTDVDQRLPKCMLICLPQRGQPGIYGDFPGPGSSGRLSHAATSSKYNKCIGNLVK